MPNWCMNTLELTHSNVEMIERAKSSFEKGTFLNEFIPMPKELQGTISPPREEDAEVNAILKARYGWDNWYDWCSANWGVKWDVGEPGNFFSDPEHPNHLILHFDSPWAPPLVGIENLRQQGFRCKLYYWEAGMCFAGISSEDQDLFYNLLQLNLNEVRSTLPPELDRAFGISNFMSSMLEDSV